MKRLAVLLLPPPPLSRREGPRSRLLPSTAATMPIMLHLREPVRLLLALPILRARMCCSQETCRRRRRAERRRAWGVHCWGWGVVVLNNFKFQARGYAIEACEEGPPDFCEESYDEFGGVGGRGAGSLVGGRGRGEGYVEGTPGGWWHLDKQINSFARKESSGRSNAFLLIWRECHELALYILDCVFPKSSSARVA